MVSNCLGLCNIFGPFDPSSDMGCSINFGDVDIRSNSLGINTLWFFKITIKNHGDSRLATCGASGNRAGIYI